MPSNEPVEIHPDQFAEFIDGFSRDLDAYAEEKRKTQAREEMIALVKWCIKELQGWSRFRNIAVVD